MICRLALCNYGASGKLCYTMPESESIQTSSREGTSHTEDIHRNGILQTEDLPAEIRKIVEEKETTGVLSLDDIFELLKNERRREVIRYLLNEPDGTATLSDLAEYIAAKENGIEIRQLSSDQRKRVYIGLYQCHLPKMDEKGVIDFENNRGTVELLSNVSQLQPYLERINNQPDQQLPLFELSITGAMLLVLTTAIVGVGPVAALPPIAWAGMSTLALIVVAVHQVTTIRQ